MSNAMQVELGWGGVVTYGTVLWGVLGNCEWIGSMYRYWVLYCEHDESREGEKEKERRWWW